LDDPGTAGTKDFIAQYYYQQGPVFQDRLRHGKAKRQEFTFVRLLQSRPEAFYLRINAKTPGIYTYSCVLTFGHMDTVVEETIVSSATCAFAGKRRKD
jgi:hypothetical protein